MGIVEILHPHRPSQTVNNMNHSIRMNPSNRLMDLPAHGCVSSINYNLNFEEKKCGKFIDGLTYTYKSGDDFSAFFNIIYIFIFFRPKHGEHEKKNSNEQQNNTI